MNSDVTDIENYYKVFALMVKDSGREAAEPQFRETFAKIPGAAEHVNEIIAAFDADAADVIDGVPPTSVALPHKPWYSDRGSEGDRHWPALKEYLSEARDWPEQRIGHLHRASSKVVAHTTDPATPGYSCKGLVVGYVQSGKTANFTAVIAKMVDHSYNLVIVLSGIHNGLRAQTQGRLDAELHELNRDLWSATTDVDRDFEKQTRTLASDINKPGARNAVLCVVKKNTAPLGKLRAWIRRAERDGTTSKVKALIIDDEADQASVETPKINPLIRDILGLLPNHTYIGYTATPFANVLIDPTVSEDLYPRNFILSLEKPDGYMGAEAIFGRDRVESDDLDPSEDFDGGDPIPLDGWDVTRIVEEHEAENFRFKKSVPFKPEVSESLRAAILYFWIATTVRRMRGDHAHSTMLVHASLQTSCHKKLKKVVGDFHASIEDLLKTGDTKLLDEMRTLWEKERLRANRPSRKYLVPDFEEISPQLLDVVECTELIVDNSLSNERLNYERRPLDPDGKAQSLVTIVIGGNTLSRGLTLEGLTVSFFLRAAKAYDTLLQMGRWFGFRPGYEDLPRIWMTEELRRWFRHLATVEHEIRLDIERYQTTVSTPTQFGVRIRTHPALAVTRKLGAAVRASTSYGGTRVQSRYFKLDAAWLDTNMRAASDLVAAIDSSAAIHQAPLRSDADSSGPVLYQEVGVAHVLRFLAEFESHEDSPDLDRRLLTDYIRKVSEDERPSLEKWNIAVMAGTDGADRTMKLGGRSFNLIRRSKLIETEHDPIADIKTLMSKEHLVVDVDLETNARELSEARLKSIRNDEHPDTGLLVLYPIQARSEPDEKNQDSRVALAAPADVIGLAMVFPDPVDTGDDSVDHHDYIVVDLSELEDSDPEAAEEGDG